jgi:hypothetical protein
MGGLVVKRRRIEDGFVLFEFMGADKKSALEWARTIRLREDLTETYAWFRDFRVTAAALWVSMCAIR